MSCYFRSAVHLRSIRRSLCMWFLCNASERLNFIILRLRIHNFFFCICFFTVKSSNLQLTKMYIASYKKSNVLRIFDSVSLNFVIKILSLQMAKLVKFCFIHKLWSKSPLTFQLLTSTTTWEFVLRFLSLSASCFLYIFFKLSVLNKQVRFFSEMGKT